MARRVFPGTLTIEAGLQLVPVDDEELGPLVFLDDDRMVINKTHDVVWPGVQPLPFR